MDQCLQMCRRGTPLSPANMGSLREVSFESTMVGVRGYILLLQALPKLHVCRVSEVSCTGHRGLLFRSERSVVQVTEGSCLDELRELASIAKHALPAIKMFLFCIGWLGANLK